MNAKVKKYLRRSLKVLLWIIGSIIGLFLLIVILLQIPYVQNIVKNKAVSYLESKIGTDVNIDRIEIGLPKKVILEGIYFETQQGDTLLSGEKLAIDISLFKLLSNEVEINSVDLQGIVANVTRDKDSVFNFDYIIDAFASENPKPEDTTSAPMKISVRNINLDRIRVKFDDAISKNDLEANITHFDTRFKTFDLDSMDFDIPTITLQGLKLKLKQGAAEDIARETQETAEEASSQPNLKLKLGDIELSDIDIAYDNEGSLMDTGLTLEKLLVEVDEIDLKTQLIAVNTIELSGVKGNLVFGEHEKQIQESLPEESPEVASAQWKFKLKNTDIKDVAFKFDDMNSAPVAKGIDYKHLDITNFSLKAEDFDYGPENISGNIQNFSVTDKSGVNVKELRTDFAYGPNGAELNNLYLETPQTLVKDQIIVGYPSLESISENIADLSIDANIEGSQIGFKDILLFVPTLADTNPFKDNPNGILYINSRVEGKVDDLHIANLDIRGIGNTTLTASGRITGLPDVQNAYFDMNVREFRSTAKDINGLVPPGTIPANIKLPANIAAKATFKGSLENFAANLNLASSYGKAKVKATFDQRRKNNEKYDADIDLDNFDVGSLITNDSLGRISLKATVKGTGLDPQTANAALKGQLIKAEFNSYTYRDLNIDGKINNGTFEATADMDDPNLDFDVVASGGFKGEYPTGKIKLNVDIADLNKLNLHAGPLKLRGNVDADITDSNPDNLNGTISLHQFIFANAEEQFGLDSISIVAESTAERNSILLKSQLANASVVGKYKITEIGTALSNSFSKYYNTSPDSTRTEISEPLYFDFALRVNNDPIISKLVPQIERLEPIDIKGRYNSNNDSITVHGTIPRVVYGSYTLSGGVLDIEKQNDSLAYSIIIDEIDSGQVHLPHTELTGAVIDNIIAYKLKINGRKEEDQYLVAGEMRAADGNTEISLNPDGLILNYEEWNIAEGNVIRFGEGGIYANNFEMSNDGGSIRLQSQSETPDAPLDVELDNFKIETLTNLVQQEELQISGVINGNAELRNLAGEPVFTSDIDITNLAVSKDTVGNVQIRVNNETADTYAAKVSITGNGNQLNIDGAYMTNNSSFDFDVDLQKLNMSSVQAFSFGALKESKGYLSGGFKITGTAAKPDINGDLKFNEVSFRVTELNSYFKSINDNITFTSTGINFDSFSVQDENNNILEINGKINTTNYTEFGLALDIDAENFRVVNSTANDNDLYYGDLFVDTNLNVRGTLKSPVVKGSLKINEDTEFTVVLPQSDPGIADREGIVEFIDEDNMEIQQRLQMEEDFNTSDYTGMDVAVSIQIVKEAELNLIIDKGNGDFLRLQGEAQLNGGIDPSGKTTLTGRYEFSEGAYEMTFNFIKRRFDIQEGSYILWTGEPTEADINITAAYKTEAAPIDLLDNQLGGVSASVRNTYKQRIPFNALLKMEGELLKPELSFDIELPEGNLGVSTEIINNTKTKLEQLRQEPSELNKQVFALLLLNRFIGENPFSSEAGGTSGESLARQSVSKILSQQLNNLAADLVSGVELNFDLESTENYTTGQREDRTDLNVGISKRLLNDRLKVTVGSSFGIEGPQQANEESTNIAGDVSLDYQLTKDGRYMVRAYRKNEYQVALQGQVIETGVAFIITMNYNDFRELFHRTEEEKEMKRREKERKERAKEEKEKRKEEENNNKEQDLPPNSEKNESEE